jgi:hypothetical protein
MRKLGLVLVLLFTLSIVSAADFTISGKITPKAGVSPLVDGDYPAEFIFSDGTEYDGQVTMTNGVFTADFSGMTNSASAIANSNKVTMAITALGQIQTFSNIPLTTVPKALYATTAGSAELNTPKSGSETNNPQLEIKYSGDTATTDNGRYWNFRAGGAAIPTVFSYYNTKQLELNRELATFYGNLNINGITKLSGKIYQDRDGDDYDVWIQGSTTVTSSNNPDRNLALLGQAKTDTLYLNYEGEYAAGTIIGSLTSPTNIKGDLTVGGKTTVASLVFSQGTGHKITTNENGLIFNGGAGEADFLVYDDKTYAPKLILGYNGAAILTTYEDGEDLSINPRGTGKTIITGDLTATSRSTPASGTATFGHTATGVLKTPSAWFGRALGTGALGDKYLAAGAKGLEMFVKQHDRDNTNYYSTIPKARSSVHGIQGSSSTGLNANDKRYVSLLEFDVTDVGYSGIRGTANFVCNSRGGSLTGGQTGLFAFTATCENTGSCSSFDQITWGLDDIGEDAGGHNGPLRPLKWSEVSDVKFSLKAHILTHDDCTVWLDYTV